MRALLLALAFLPGCASAKACNAPVCEARIVRSFPHDPNAFTEGLFYRDGKLFESTGLNGRSSIREVRLEDGKVLRSVDVDRRYFGEGIVDWGNELISLTWQHGIGFRWTLGDFRQTGSFRYPGEGWALTRTASELIMSDGTPQIRFLDPATLKEKRRITVTDQGQRLSQINEVEYVKGEILANIWMTNRIARIDPKSGVVRGWIDLSKVAEDGSPGGEDAVPNGIAYDAKGDRLFVTGKLWPKLYEVRLVPVPALR
jgi:glutaminyl-peptide cyclotransferase